MNDDLSEIKKSYFHILLTVRFGENKIKKFPFLSIRFKAEIHFR